MTAQFDPEQIHELRLLHKEYELELERTESPEEKIRIRRILQELRSCILRLESLAS